MRFTFVFCSLAPKMKAIGKLACREEEESPPFADESEQLMTFPM